MGVPTDVDGLIKSALDLRLAFLEDARRDMAQVSVPVTWIHGANDAWLDLERVRDVMGAGDASRRKLIEVPTGHQLRSSKEALNVFMLVAEECAGMAVGRSIKGALPRLAELESRREAERARLSVVNHDVRAFWRNYLLGRGDMLGIELMNATRAYDGLMAAQIAGLELDPGCVVADVGSGTGSFLLALLDSPRTPKSLCVDEIDYVPEAFTRAKERLARRGLGDITVRFVECDLESPIGREQAFEKPRYDAVLLSLVLSYVRDPLGLLRALYGGMRPGGRLVASTLQRDADISRLYLESVDELRSGRARKVLGVKAEATLDDSVRTFLNDMARVLDFEEQGVFRFLDAHEVVDLVRDAGFEDVRTFRAFGDPPQAIVVAARKAHS
jgi:SAM-dependent methyltransferase